MNNNVLVTVHGLQHEIDDKEGIQTKQTGNYRLVAGKHIISYKEYFRDEETGRDATISNLLKISGDTVTLTKRGATNTEMTFKTGKTQVFMKHPLVQCRCPLILHELTSKKLTIK